MPTLVADFPYLQDLIEVDSNGVHLLLQVPADAEFISASVVLSAVGTVETLPSHEMAVTQGVDWISADWGDVRPLHSVVSGGVSGTLQVSTGGPWFPPTTVDPDTVSNSWSVPGVEASRALVSYTTGSGPSLTIQVSSRPADVSVLVGSEVVYTHSGSVLRNVYVRTPPFLEALNQQLGPPGTETEILLTLKSQTSGTLRLIQASFPLARRFVAFTDPAEVTELAWEAGQQAEATLDLDVFTSLRAVSVGLDITLDAERLVRSNTAPLEPGGGLACTPDRLVAQAFAELTAPISSLALYLRPLTATVSGTVTLVADTRGAPGPTPAVALPFSFSEDDEAPWPWRWLRLSPETPTDAPAPVWWVVLEIDEGEVLWAADAIAESAPADEVTPELVASRSRTTAWAPAGPAGETWALTEVLVPVVDPPAPTVRWTRGDISVEAQLDEQGQATLDASDLTTLGASTATSITLVVEGTTAGTARITQLKVVAQEPIPRFDGVFESFEIGRL